MRINWWIIQLFPLQRVFCPVSSPPVCKWHRAALITPGNNQTNDFFRTVEQYQAIHEDSWHVINYMTLMVLMCVCVLDRCIWSADLGEISGAARDQGKEPVTPHSFSCLLTSLLSFCLQHFSLYHPPLTSSLLDGWVRHCRCRPAGGAVCVCCLTAWVRLTSCCSSDEGSHPNTLYISRFVSFREPVTCKHFHHVFCT